LEVSYISDVVKVNDASWNEIVIESKKPVFVMFYSPTCPHCQNIKPFVEKYAEEYENEVLFAQLNVAENQIIASNYSVMGTPTFLFFCKGKPVNSIVGAVYPALLKKTIEDGIQFGEDCRSKTTWIDPNTGYA